jgi:hypothetical protein
LKYLLNFTQDLAVLASAPLNVFDRWGASPHEVYVTNL